MAPFSLHFYWQKSHEIIREYLPWGAWLAKALLLIRNILFCFHGDRCRGIQWSGAESMSLPKNVHSACLLGQSQGCSLPHPRVMGQVLVSAPPGCNTHIHVHTHICECVFDLCLTWWAVSHGLLSMCTVNKTFTLPSVTLQITSP